MDYYGYALQRGADSEVIYKKIGMTHMEMREVELARVYFKKVVKLNKKDAEGWNDLGAVEYLDKNLTAAISDYKRAAKLDKTPRSTTRTWGWRISIRKTTRIRVPNSRSR